MLFPLRDENPTSTIPVLTYALIVGNLALWMYEVSLSESALNRFIATAGATPVHLMRVTDHALTEAGTVLLTPLTYMFLHGSWMHVLGNMWFLWVFGDNIEDRLGKLRFVTLYLGTGAIAVLTQTALDPQSAIPIVGASGAVSGVLGAYAVLYPRARIYTFVWLILFIRFFYLPAILYLGMWFGWQFLSLGEAGVAWWAHIGGFIAGAVGGLILRRR